MNKPSLYLSTLLLAGGVSTARAEITPNPLFVDHAVLQQGMNIPVWGVGQPGEMVVVEMAGQKAATTTDQTGKWRVHLPPMKAGGPFTLTIAGKNTITLSDIMVGEVWVAGGQSNMERQLGLRQGQQPIAHWEKEVAQANYPLIRHFGVAQTKSFTPLSTVQGRWEVCSPATVREFTAVGYFFGRDLHLARKVPIGIIHSSWGGTPAEAWTSETGLNSLPDFAETMAHVKLVQADPAGAQRKHEEKLESWFMANDAGSAKTVLWSDPAIDTAAWKDMKVPALWESEGEPDLNGVVWYRKEFELPDGTAGSPAELRLGMVDDIDTTWLNGVKLGSTPGYNVKRNYAVPTGVLKPGRNVIAVRVLDTGGGGGIWGDEPPRLHLLGKAIHPPIELGGPWRYRIGLNLQTGPWPPHSMTGDSNTPTVLFNGMIAPLLPYAIRGVIWYQGESNVHHAAQYQKLFPATIADWRRAWGQGDFPFLFVQIAPYRNMTPELREAQLIAWRNTANTAMAVTLDCGDATDIHPARKQPVGARLALAARALAYGEPLEYTGPIFDALTIKGGQATVRFTRVGGGLVAKRGPLKGFTIAGADHVFHPAKAVIRGMEVVVTSPRVPRPEAIRYGWANVPEGNLFNKDGLPASPFRTDRN